MEKEEMKKKRKNANVFKEKKNAKQIFLVWAKKIQRSKKIFFKKLIK